jgi:Family of unknown function (DUF5522)
MSNNKNLKPIRPKALEKSVLTEGVDFYIENGLYVFSEKYLKARGYCCGNGCRHCPYDKDILPTTTKKQPDKSN